MGVWLASSVVALLCALYAYQRQSQRWHRFALWISCASSVCCGLMNGYRAFFFADHFIGPAANLNRAEYLTCYDVALPLYRVAQFDVALDLLSLYSFLLYGVVMSGYKFCLADAGPERLLSAAAPLSSSQPKPAAPAVATQPLAAAAAAHPTNASGTLTRRLKRTPKAADASVSSISKK
jgi:hypothetical protein